MSWSVRLLRIRGIDIRVHASFLLVLVWAAYVGLTSAGGRQNGWWQGAVFMVGFMLLLFVCVVLHELGHSLVAQLFGIEVRDITLWPIGGVARLARSPERPSQEFLITAAGPAINILLVVLIGALLMAWVGPSQVIRTLLSPGQVARLMLRADVQALLYLLLLNNFLLALFNLVPAFPMDGGRLLRALLAVVLPFRRATQIAAIIGQIVAGLMVGAGLYISDTLLMLVGVFVFLGAWQERQQVSTVESLRHVLVRDVMQPLGARVHPLDTIGDVVSRVGLAGQAAYVVVDGGRLAGLLSRSELLRALRKGGPQVRVAQCVARQAPHLRPDEPLLHAQERLSAAHVTVAAVVEEGRVVATVSGADLARAAELLEAFPEALTQRRAHEHARGS